MSWQVEYTDKLETWWTTLSVEEQIAIDRSVRLLEAQGPHLGFPHSSDVRSSRHTQMRELRVQHRGRPYRVLYAFDPRRAAILLIGGEKTGDDRWYERFVPSADDLYDQHLDALRREGVS